MCNFISDTVVQDKNRKFFQPDCDICGKPNAAQQLNGDWANDIKYGSPRWRIYVDPLTKQRYHACGCCHELIRPGNKPTDTIVHWKEVINNVR
tara:strand:- start:1180 stop:1458 length:279 start_codon:yes stop_codon:yes gene_type:complete